MRVLLRSVLTGCAVTVALVCLATIPSTDSGIGKTMESTAIFLLGPGILAGFAAGSGRVHDVSFWALTVILNAVFYSLLAYVVGWVARSLRARASVH